MASLCAAAARGDVADVKLLVANNVLDRRAALEKAAENGHIQVVEVLLQAGVDPCEGDDDDASSSSSTPLAKAACRAARTSNLTVLSAFLDHLKTAHAPVDAVVEAAVAAAEVRDSRYPEQQQEVVKRLLVSARMQDSASMQAALQEQFPEGREAGALFARVFMDVMLEVAAKVEDAKAQKQAMQHLFTATMASAKAQAAAKEAQKQ